MANHVEDYDRLVVFLRGLPGPARIALEPTGDFHRPLATDDQPSTILTFSLLIKPSGRRTASGGKVAASAPPRPVQRLPHRAMGPISVSHKRMIPHQPGRRPRRALP
jgi:hypothetical protein